MFSKKGDLSMSTIVMAVIALLILIVLATMIVRYLGGTNTQIDVCDNKGGTCLRDGRTCDDIGKQAYNAWVCRDSAGNRDFNAVCCV